MLTGTSCLRRRAEKGPALRSVGSIFEPLALIDRVRWRRFKAVVNF